MESAEHPWLGPARMVTATRVNWPPTAKTGPQQWRHERPGSVQTPQEKPTLGQGHARRRQEAPEKAPHVSPYSLRPSRRSRARLCRGGTPGATAAIAVPAGHQVGPPPEGRPDKARPNTAGEERLGQLTQRRQETAAETAQSTRQRPRTSQACGTRPPAELGHPAEPQPLRWRQSQRNSAISGNRLLRDSAACGRRTPVDERPQTGPGRSQHLCPYDAPKDSGLRRTSYSMEEEKEARHEGSPHLVLAEPRTEGAAGAGAGTGGGAGAGPEGTAKEGTCWVETGGWRPTRRT